MSSRGIIWREVAIQLEREQDYDRFRATGFSYEDINHILQIVHTRNPRVALLQIAMKGEVKPEELRQLKQAYPGIRGKIDEIATLKAKPFILALCRLLITFESATKAFGGVCPECEGKIQVLGPESRFCLDCEWDDLGLINEGGCYRHG